MQSLQQFHSRKQSNSLIWHGVVVAAAVLVALIYSLFVDPLYRAEAKLVVADAQRQSVLGNVSGIAGALGIPFDAAFSPLNMYAEYLRSRDLHHELVGLKLPTAGGDSTRILDNWGGTSDLAERRIVEAIEMLDDHLSVRTDESAGLLEVRIDLFDPFASAYLANLLVVKLNEFDSELRRWSGSNRMEFLQNRASEVQAELAYVEEELLDFRLTNRQRDTPRLQLDEMRLLRDVSLRAQVLETILAQQEIAAIEAKTESPVLKSIQIARVPVDPIWPNRLRLMAVFGMVALALVVLISLLRGRGRGVLADTSGVE